MPSAIIGSVAGFFGARNAAKNANQAAGMQTQLGQSQASMAQKMMDLSGGQFSMGTPALQKAMQHYMTLSTGTRGAIDTELAPERAQAASTYAGAQRGLEAKIGAGPTRDRAEATLAQQKAGQMGLMPMQAREAAFGQLNTAGNQAFGRGFSAVGAGQKGFEDASRAYDSAYSKKKDAGQAWSDYGSSLASLWGGPLDNLFKNKGWMS